MLLNVCRGKIAVLWQKKQYLCQHNNNRKIVKWGKIKQITFTLHKQVVRKIQRYKCKVCGKTFTKAKKYHFSLSLKEEYIKRHIEGKSSYRDLSHSSGIDKMKICNWVKEYALNSKTTKEVSQELKPKWSGYLVVDGKTIKVRGKRNCLAIGIDYTADIPLTEYEIGPENKSQYVRFFKNLKELNYPLRGLISDGREDIHSAAKQVYDCFHHQLCLKHFLKSIDRTFGYLTVKRSRLEKDYQLELELRSKLYELIYTKDYYQFLDKYHSIRSKRKYFKSGYCQKMHFKIQNNLHSIIAHYFDPKLCLTNNSAENIIKQLNRRLKLIEGFQSSITAESYLRLLVMYLRFKPYTDARNIYKHRNGKNRLELSGAKTKDINWLKFSQKSK